MVSFLYKQQKTKPIEHSVFGEKSMDVNDLFYQAVIPECYRI